MWVRQRQPCLRRDVTRGPPRSLEAASVLGGAGTQGQAGAVRRHL